MEDEILLSELPGLFFGVVCVSGVEELSVGVIRVCFDRLRVLRKAIGVDDA